MKRRKLMSNKIEDALIDGIRMVAEKGKGEPLNMFVLGYGQVLKDGKVTPEGEEWVRLEFCALHGYPNKCDCCDCGCLGE
jgi:hypothetical protein